MIRALGKAMLRWRAGYWKLVGLDSVIVELGQRQP